MALLQFAVEVEQFAKQETVVRHAAAGTATAMSSLSSRVSSVPGDRWLPTAEHPAEHAAEHAAEELRFVQFVVANGRRLRYAVPSEIEREAIVPSCSLAVGVEDLRGLVHTGWLADTVLVCAPGLDQWVQWGAVAEQLSEGAGDAESESDGVVAEGAKTAVLGEGHGGVFLELSMGVPSPVSVTAAEMALMASHGAATLSTKVWAPGMAEWVALGTCAQRWAHAFETQAQLHQLLDKGLAPAGPPGHAAPRASEIETELPQTNAKPVLSFEDPAHVEAVRAPVELVLPRTPEGFGITITDSGAVVACVAGGVGDMHAVPVPSRIVAVDGVAVHTKRQIADRIGSGAAGWVRFTFEADTTV